MVTPNALDSAAGQPVAMGNAEFARVYGESLGQALDLTTWRPGEDIADLYERLEREVAAALAQSDDLRADLRAMVFANIGAASPEPIGAGVYQATPQQLERVHHGLLFAGHVEACDGSSATHDSLVLTVTSLGVVLVSYQGDQGTWGHRLFRRDLRATSGDRMADLLDLLDRRGRRSDDTEQGEEVANLTRRGIMAYAERATLLGRSEAAWRMGHGHPIPYEMIRGSGLLGLVEASVPLLRRLVAHERFIFVPSNPRDRLLRTIGDALNPLEYAIVDTVERGLARIVEAGHYGAGQARLVRDFVGECGPRVVRGVFRAAGGAPPYVFYAHVARAHEAALVAMADAALQEHRGFPLLIDLADIVSRHAFSADATLGLVRSAYAAHGEPYRFLAERETR
jgi:hypothetical protein